MSDPQQSDSKPAPIQNPAGGAGSYPLQLLFLLVVFALAIGVYIYFTGDDEGGSSSLGPRIEHSADRVA